MAIKTVYIRKTGNNSNSGLTEALAKLTLSGGNAILVSGDTMDIGAGTWTEDAQIGYVSGAIYQGTGMYQTMIVGTLQTEITNTYTMKDMKFTATEKATRGQYIPSCERVHFDMSVTLTDPANGVDMFRVPVTGGVVHNNVIVDGWKATGNSRMYGVIPSDTTTTINNCVYANCDLYYFMFYWGGGTASFRYRNCIFYNNTISYFGYAGGDDKISVDSDFNCIYDTLTRVNGGTTISVGDNGFTSDPLFTSPSAGDFSLLPESPLIGKGTAIL